MTRSHDQLSLGGRDQKPPAVLPGAAATTGRLVQSAADHDGFCSRRNPGVSNPRRTRERPCASPEPGLEGSVQNDALPTYAASPLAPVRRSRRSVHRHGQRRALAWGRCPLAWCGLHLHRRMLLAAHQQRARVLLGGDHRSAAVQLDRALGAVVDFHSHTIDFSAPEPIRGLHLAPPPCKSRRQRTNGTRQPVHRTGGVRRAGGSPLRLNQR